MTRYLNTTWNTFLLCVNRSACIVPSYQHISWGGKLLGCHVSFSNYMKRCLFVGKSAPYGNHHRAKLHTGAREVAKKTTISRALVSLLHGPWLALSNDWSSAGVSFVDSCLCHTATACCSSSTLLHSQSCENVSGVAYHQTLFCIFLHFYPYFVFSVDEEQKWLAALEAGELDDAGQLKSERNKPLTARQVRKCVLVWSAFSNDSLIERYYTCNFCVWMSPATQLCTCVFSFRNWLLLPSLWWGFFPFSLSVGLCWET